MARAVSFGNWEHDLSPCRLEEAIQKLEVALGAARAEHQMNAETLDYNARVLAEHAVETSAALMIQKRRLVRLRDILSRLKASTNGI